jgi:hypothetical protein
MLSVSWHRIYNTNLSLQFTMKSSCHFVFNHSVLLCPNLYSATVTKIHKITSSAIQLFSCLLNFLPLTAPQLRSGCKRPSLSPINLIVEVFTVLLPSTVHGRYLLRIVVRITQQRTLYQESVFAGPYL